MTAVRGWRIVSKCRRLTLGFSGLLAGHCDLATKQSTPRNDAPSIWPIVVNVSAIVGGAKMHRIPQGNAPGIGQKLRVVSGCCASAQFRRESPARDADHRRKPGAKCRVGREQRVAGGKAIAGKKVVAKSSRLAQERDGGGAVPRVDVKFAIRLDAARGDVGEPQCP